MFFLKIGLLTCAVYLAITLLAEGATWIVVWRYGSLLVRLSPWFYAPFFAVVWVVSFSVAWRIFMHIFRSHISH
jgi:hypothetical protein